MLWGGLGGPLDLSLALRSAVSPAALLFLSLSPCPSESPLSALHLSLLLHFPSPGLSFFWVPRPCSVCLGPPPPLSAVLALSQQRPSPVAAAPLAQGPALTVTHWADGGDFDEEATPPPAGA